MDICYINFSWRAIRIFGVLHFHFKLYCLKE